MGIDVSKFLKTPEFELRITTYRDIFQVEALEYDKFGDEYKALSAVIVMSKYDMEKRGLKTGDCLRLTNENGGVVVKVKESKRDEPSGIAFMVNSPWSNSLVSDTEFKDIKAKASITKDEVTSIEKIIENISSQAI